MTIYVPQGYVLLLKLMSGATGIPYQVAAAQGYVESGFDDSAVSSAGAEGWLQFLPSTFYAYWHGSPFNRVDAANAWILYMRHLLLLFAGSIYWALAAYNAGEGNPGAGEGYARLVLGLAGEGTSITSGGGVPVPAISGPPSPAATNDDWSERIRRSADQMRVSARNHDGAGRAIRRM